MGDRLGGDGRGNRRLTEFALDLALVVEHTAPTNLWAELEPWLRDLRARNGSGRRTIYLEFVGPVETPDRQ